MSLSFGYLATDKATREDGVQELRELDLFEISLVAAPANADTRILSYKSADPEEPKRTPRPALTRDRSSASATSGTPCSPLHCRQTPRWFWSAKRSARPATCGVSATASASKSRSGGTTT